MGLKSYEHFLELSKEKIVIVDKLLSIKNSDVADINRLLKRMKILNKGIIAEVKNFVVDIGRDREITKSFLYKLLKRRINNDLKQISDKEGYYEYFKYYMARINENLKDLSELMKKENDMISTDKLWVLSSVLQNLKEHGELFKCIYEERGKIHELSIHLIAVLNCVNNISKSRQYENLVDKLKDLNFIQASPYSKDFKSFYYGPYMRRFPDPNERESYSILNEMMRKGGYIVLLAKVDKEIIGGIVYSKFNYLYNGENVQIGIIYWVCVEEDARDKAKTYGVYKHVGTKLVDACTQDLTYRSFYSGGTLHGIFIEPNDPSKMSAKEISEDAMDPKIRIDFWQNLGYKRVFKDYIQLTAPRSYVNYCSLFVRPLTKRWSVVISSDEVYNIVLTMAKYSCNYDEKFLSSYPIWLKMVALIRKEKYFPLEGPLSF